MLHDHARLAGMRRVIIARRFKLAAAPFHMWSPDVYEGAPTSSSTFFAVVPKAGVILVRTNVCMGAFIDLFEV